MRTVVVYVHGLWLNGWESLLLRQRLSRQLHCTTSSFPYSSIGAGLEDNVLALARFLGGLHADTLHLVGHSMGGAVILELFERIAAGDAGAAGSAGAAGKLPPGRIVLLGSPVRGSRAARNLSQRAFGRRMLGRTARAALLPERDRQWCGERELGIIAGTVPMGFGRLLGPLGAPSDGTVLVEETRIHGAKQHLSLRTTHSGMLYSALVAGQIAAFLREGTFATDGSR
jgi:pimeloyl-ACP methyl ester carboxylesterase